MLAMIADWRSLLDSAIDEEELRDKTRLGENKGREQRGHSAFCPLC
jgi:hypothetical protein